MNVTIHKALAELKVLDAKIEKGIQEIFPVAIHQQNKKIGGHTEPEEFKKRAQAAYDSVTDLIARKSKIKSAIVESNSKTKVKIGNTEMTVADAINKKANIKFEKNLLTTLLFQRNRHVQQLEDNNKTVDKNCQTLVEVTFGKDNAKADPDQIKTISDNFMAQNKWVLFDPLNISDKIDKLTASIEEFEVEVDAALSVSNAITTVDI